MPLSHSVLHLGHPAIRREVTCMIHTVTPVLRPPPLLPHFCNGILKIGTFHFRNSGLENPHVFHSFGGERRSGRMPWWSPAADPTEARSRRETADFPQYLTPAQPCAVADAIDYEMIDGSFCQLTAAVGRDPLRRFFKRLRTHNDLADRHWRQRVGGSSRRLRRSEPTPAATARRASTRGRNVYDRGRKAG